MFDLMTTIGSAALFGWSALSTHFMLHGEVMKGALMIGIPEVAGILGVVTMYNVLKKANGPGWFVLFIFPIIIQAIYASGSLAYIALYSFKHLLLNNI